ncbi:protein TonB [Sphingomonas guangdongensis]|uniref:Protein TonB n=1 Tax=Sphingomonas guangdongensis TaxID=1141890 RepID=A0A285R044_9SPHN|nr:TonB family protein [Sphingomonas guangdongensis]SOB87029.1 protein TonB [Sphingomonas guangdongensis]
MSAYARTFAGDRRARARGGIAAAVVCVAVGYALLLGLAVRHGVPTDDPLAVFEIAPEPPPPKQRSIPPPRRSRRPEGAAAPPNLRAKPTEIVAPKVELILPPPLPVVVTAPVAGPGAEASAGASDRPGPGTGAGGIGTGFGGGGDGDGDGGGWRDETPPELIRGRLRDSDYPRGLGDEGISGTVGVRYLVWSDGRVRTCRVTRSSGSDVLDRLTCRLIQERFRFRPSRDGLGRAVPAEIVESHSWIVEEESEEQ